MIFYYIIFFSFLSSLFFLFFFFFNDPATTEIYTLSLHDALPIWPGSLRRWSTWPRWIRPPPDRKSTRLNSSHVSISYAVFCLKKKNTKSVSYNCSMLIRIGGLWLLRGSRW